jgi:pyrroloquinoline quinone (PQQ) biosynthesis protein C
MDKVSHLADPPVTPPLRAQAALSLSGSVLWMKMALAQRMLNIAAQRFWSHPNLLHLFPSFLGELYSIVSCSVPLMSAAHQRATELAGTDPLAAKTAEYLKAHMEEELHHDEWLLNDLVASGMDRADILNRAPSANIARLVGAQYCWIRHAHPAALFGYLGVIEGNPPLPEHLEEIRLQTGYPAETFRCMHLHAADDIEHLRELRATITELPLTENNSALIATSAFATMDGLVSILEDLIANQKPAPE